MTLKGKKQIFLKNSIIKGEMRNSEGKPRGRTTICPRFCFLTPSLFANYISPTIYRTGPPYPSLGIVYTFLGG